MSAGQHWREPWGKESVVASNETIRKVVAEYFAALRAMDPEAWANTFAEDGVTHDPVGTPPHQGRAALRRFLQGILSMFQEAGLTEDDIFVAGNGAAVKWTGRGVAKNGRPIQFEGIDVFEVNEAGKIQEVRAYWDAAAVMAQLGQ
jgi:steroid Delta-isomerase